MGGREEDARQALSTSNDTRSELSGSAGDVVQARDVSGGVHFHGAGPAPGPVPRQLPGDVRGFVNRVVEIARLDEVLATEDPHSITLAVIAGTAGVGKTSLAVHWAHRVRDRFPDGQLYVNLRGYDPGEPVTSDEALDHFLRALDVSSGAIPARPQARESLYRSLVADRRMLIVLDNAFSVRQVRPLLPGTASCAVLVTSRSRLSGLVARDGAQRVTVDTLTSSEAISLLGLVTGKYRNHDDPEEMAELARLCARLPLALRIAAERAASRPLMPLRELIRDLRDESELWDALSAEDDEESDAVRTVFAWSNRALPPDAARLFRLLGLHPGAHFSAPAAAALCGTGEREARHLLDVLVGAHLVEQPAPGHYQFHDLLRAYSTDQARHLESTEHQREALTRLFDWYLHTARSVAIALHPHWILLDLPQSVPHVTPVTIADHSEAQRWYEAELTNLTAITRAAADCGMDRIAWQLPAVMREVYSYRNPFEDWFTVTRIGLDAARRSGDRLGEALLLESLGWASKQSHRLTDSLDYHGAALEIWRERGDRSGEARALNGIGLAYSAMRRLEEARARFEMAVDIAADVDDRRVAAASDENLGSELARLNDFDRGVRFLRRALSTYKSLDDRLFTSSCMISLAEALCGLGQEIDALSLAEEAVSIALEVGNIVWEGHHLNHLGQIQRANGRHSDALTSYQRSASIHRRIGDRGREALALNGAGEIYGEMGRLDEAADFHRQAVAFQREVGDRWHQAVALDDLAAVLNLAGDVERAQVHWREVLPLIADFSDPRAVSLRDRVSRSLGDNRTT